MKKKSPWNPSAESTSGRIDRIPLGGSGDKTVRPQKLGAVVENTDSVRLRGSHYTTKDTIRLYTCVAER